jgi:hypothetical protein
MNEKIKKLALQAGLSEDTILANYGFEPEQFKWSGHGRNIDKFAELIINECINQLSSITVPFVSELFEDHDIGYNSGLETGIKVIKQNLLDS